MSSTKLQKQGKTLFSFFFLAMLLTACAPNTEFIILEETTIINGSSNASASSFTISNTDSWINVTNSTGVINWNFTQGTPVTSLNVNSSIDARTANLTSGSSDWNSSATQIITATQPQNLTIAGNVRIQSNPGSGYYPVNGLSIAAPSPMVHLHRASSTQYSAIGWGGSATTYEWFLGLYYNTQDCLEVGWLWNGSMDIKPLRSCIRSDMAGGFVELNGGTAALPGLTLANQDGSVTDRDTGLYRVGANQLGITASGSSVAIFNTSGTYVGGSSVCTQATGCTSSGPSPVKFVNLMSGAVTATNAPATEQALANSYHFIYTNLSTYTTFRFGIARAGTAGAAAFNIYIKYKTGACNTLTGSSWSNLSASDFNLSATAANNVQATASYNSIVAGAQDDVCVGAFSVGGDGVLDPQFRNVWVEFK